MYFPQFPDKPIYSHPLGGYVKFSYLALWEEVVSKTEIGRKQYISKLIYDDEDDLIEILVLIAGKLN